jgi:hypothetical protein
VLAIARDGDAVYLGGNFRYLGHPRGGGVSLDITTAEPSVTSPRVVGQVFVVRPDDRGGWYIGGSFSHVGSLPRSNLAHILGMEVSRHGHRIRTTPCTRSSWRTARSTWAAISCRSGAGSGGGLQLWTP